METIARTAVELNNAWAWTVYPFVKPIIEADPNGRPVPVGSSILISSGEKKCLLTAFHVIKRPADQISGTLYTFLPELSEIIGHSIVADDPFDIALVEVSTPLQCLRIPQHLALNVRERELCLVLGFQSRAKCWKFNHADKTMRASPFAYLGTVLRLSGNRLALKLSRKQIRRDGNPIPDVGRLNGISGGGAFVLRDGRPRLAGFVIEYDKNREELVCTNSHMIDEMVKQLETSQRVRKAPFHRSAG